MADNVFQYKSSSYPLRLTARIIAHMLVLGFLDLGLIIVVPTRQEAMSQEMI